MKRLPVLATVLALLLIAAACSPDDKGDLVGGRINDPVNEPTTTVDQGDGLVPDDGPLVPKTGPAGESGSCSEIGGDERCWLQYVPPGLDGPAPLVIDMHGWTSTAAAQKASSGFWRLAETEGFVVAWPDGLNNSWNAGGACCPPSSRDGIDDVTFLLTLVDELSDQYEIDQTRLYLTGHSNGCAMAQRVANDASDRFAAVACMSLYLLVDANTELPSIPVMEIHGTSDPVVPYDDSLLFDGAARNMATWRSRNGCDDTSTLTEGDTTDEGLTWRTEVWDQCDAGVEVVQVSLDGVGHFPYPQGLDIPVGDDRELPVVRGISLNTPEIAYGFLSRFQR